MPLVDEYVTLGEGETPLVPLDKLAKRLKMGRLSAKLESHNPTGSFHDRVAAMSMSLARTRGKKGWIATCSESAGMALAAYGARAGLPGLLCVVSSAPGQDYASLLPFGAHVVGVQSAADGMTSKSMEEMFARIAVSAEQHNLYLASAVHTHNHDGMRGLDAIGYELAEQAPKASHVYVPTGGGGLAAAIGRGLKYQGIKAKMIACQPAGCAPVVYFLSGVSSSPTVYRCESKIAGLQVPHPPDGRLAADAVRKSGGWGTVASDDEIIAAQSMLAATEGIFVEAAGGAALAAMIKDLEYGRIDATGHQILVLSGAGWKDMGRYGAAAAAPPVVDVADLQGQVDRWAEELNDKP
nr:pyridoxal-phosphate dependent enzyme [Phytoactinopolyspora alkaliphila]